MQNATALPCPNARTGEVYTHDQVLELVQAAYERGRFDAEVNDLRGSWLHRPEPHLTHDRRIAQRVADMENCADHVNQQLGRPTGYQYRGGIVDWNTGMPAGSACAWLRKQRTITRASYRAAA